MRGASSSDNASLLPTTSMSNGSTSNGIATTTASSVRRPGAATLSSRTASSTLNNNNTTTTSTSSSLGDATTSRTNRNDDATNANANNNMRSSASKPHHQQRSTTSQRRRRGGRPEAIDNFHPKLITSQIVALQCLHYTAQGLLFELNYLIFNTHISVDRIFTDAYVHLWHATGWPDVVAIFLSALVGAFLLAIIVEKSKKVLDFGLTHFLLHLLLTRLYTGRLPRTGDWWVVHLASTLVMVLVGEYLCSLREMADIPLLQI